MINVANQNYCGFSKVLLLPLSVCLLWSNFMNWVQAVTLLQTTVRFYAEFWWGGWCIADCNSGTIAHGVLCSRQTNCPRPFEKNSHILIWVQYLFCSETWVCPCKPRISRFYLQVQMRSSSGFSEFEKGPINHGNVCLWVGFSRGYMAPVSLKNTSG